ncbi:13737_t:CDS:1 [Acaulospora morrowiae]|uniref:13737_t:CDS:1 n=1 Tax=Acaulospora morrowiae TaxID=94023 RepID=A0A9N8VXP3_9GLOM|nr:13737_t:CDS:1 [Acaulospora morrowiae]
MTDLVPNLSLRRNSTEKTYQVILNRADPYQKTTIRHLKFSNNGPIRAVIDGTDFKVIATGEGNLNLAQFPNLAKITFQDGINVDNLDSIDISGNEKLGRMIIGSSGKKNPFRSSRCVLLVKENQVDQIIVSYYEQKNSIEKKLRKQDAIPYRIVESQQSGGEMERLRQIIAEKDKQIERLQTEGAQRLSLSQFQELTDLVLPGSEFDHAKFKQEIIRLKLEDLVPYLQGQKERFDGLVIDLKRRVGDSLKPIVDLLMKTRKDIFEQTNINNNEFAQGKLQGELAICQTLLQTSLAQEELQSLLTAQDEMLKIEMQIANLQRNQRPSA